MRASDLPLYYNAVDILERNLPTRASKIALYSPARELTFQLVSDEANQVGHALKALGVRFGECVGILANALDPAMGHYALFEDDSARTDQSERLRKDLWIFREMCRYTADALEQPEATPEAAEPLRRYATEFRDVGYQLLRHSDRELFDRFLDLLEGWSGRRGESTQIRMQRLRDDCHRFAEILERALDLVSKRSELQKIPIDEASYREALAKVQKGR